MPDKPQLIAKIREWAEEHQVPVSKQLERLSEDRLTLLWIRLQMAE